MREVVDHELPDCEIRTKFNFKLDSDVPNAILNPLCDVGMSFLSIMDLIPKF